MQREFVPGLLDVRAFAQAGATLVLDTPLGRFSRLAEEMPFAVADLGALRPVHWTARGELRVPQAGLDQVWLHLLAEASVPLTCQRCLQPVDVALHADRSFRFVADEETAAAQDDEADEDLLVMEKDFDLEALVEDELLMALPLVPRHENCPVEVKLAVVDADFDAGENQGVHPFAVLASLRDNKPK